MWDIQERDGHCEFGTGQTPNPWKKDDDEDDDDDDDVLHGCRTWSYMFAGHKLRIHENVVLRKIFGPKKTKGTKE